MTEPRAAVTPEAAPPFQTKSWTTENELPSNTIRDLLQTRDGYLWVATKGGLARFDGLRFRIFKEELSAATGGELSCQDLTEDTEGRLWMRANDAVVLYQNGRFERIDLGPRIQTMKCSSAGGLLVGTADRGLFWREASTQTHHWATTNGLLGDTIGLLRDDGHGGVWVGEHLRSWTVTDWQRLEARTGTLQSLDEVLGRSLGNVKDVVPGSEGDLWIAADTSICHFLNGHCTEYPFPTRLPGLGNVAAEESGGLWMAPPGAEKLFRLKDGVVRAYSMADGLADTDIRPLLWDREGNLWVGYGSGGVQRLRPRGLASFFSRNPEGTRQQIDSVAISPAGGVWLGSWNGLLHWDGNLLERTSSPFPGHGDIRPVWQDRAGKIWCGCRGHGLLTESKGTLTPALEANLGRTNWTVRTLFEDREGRLWVGSDDGLLEKRGAGFIRHGVAQGLPDEKITGIRQSEDGSLWIGTAQGGLCTWKEGRIRSVPLGEERGFVNPLLAEADGTLWVGTPAGLMRRSVKGETARITEAQGLHANELFCLLDDGAGFYWANSARGIFRVRREDLHAVADGRQKRLYCVSYGENDGAATAEGSGDFQPNACRAADGRLWFSTTHGATVLDPAALVEREVRPLVVIEEILADEQRVFADGGIPHAAPVNPRTGQVRLAPRRAHSLEARYTANTFVAPERVRFRFRLQGFDPDWREEGVRRTAVYTNLRPRSYRFEVEASTREGVWSKSPAAFEFSIEPAFVETPWFPALCALGLLGAGAGLGFWRVRWQQRVLLAQQQARLDQERARIARDLHDDLGTALTGLALELDVARNQMTEASAVSSRIEGAAGRTRELAERMREVVWAVNPRCDTVPSLAGFLEQQTAQFLRSDGIRGRLEFPEDIPALTVDSEARHQLALAVREALTNVVRHAHATEVTVSLEIQDGRLVVQVADNGTSWEQGGDKEATGQGLLNMRRRMEQVGGVVEIQPSAAGTRVTFRVPLRNPTAQPHRNDTRTR